MEEILMTYEEFRNYLVTVNQLTWVGMEILTPKRMNDFLDYWLIDPVTGKKRKNPNPTPNPFLPNGIESEQRLFRIICGFNYKKTVERRRKRKNLVPEFQTESDRKPWFHHVSNCVVKHNEKEEYYFMYLRCQRSMIEQRYIHNGNNIDKTLFENYLVKSNNRYGNQGLGDDSVPVEVVNLTNIKRISINGRNIRLSVGNTDPNLVDNTEVVMV